MKMKRMGAFLLTFALVLAMVPGFVVAAEEGDFAAAAPAAESEAAPSAEPAVPEQADGNDVGGEGASGTGVAEGAFGAGVTNEASGAAEASSAAAEGTGTETAAAASPTAPEQQADDNGLRVGARNDMGGADTTVISADTTVIPTQAGISFAADSADEEMTGPAKASAGLSALSDEISALAAPTISAAITPGPTWVAYTFTLDVEATVYKTIVPSANSTPDAVTLKGLQGETFSAGTSTLRSSGGLTPGTGYVLYFLASNSEGDTTVQSVPFTTDSLSTNASLISVAGQAISVLPDRTGTEASPYLASITVPNSKAAISNNDIVAAAGASAVLYNSGFTTPLSESVALSVGGNDLYIKVTAEDTTITAHYHVTVTRAATGASAVISDVTVAGNVGTAIAGLFPGITITGDTFKQDFSQSSPALDSWVTNLPAGLHVGGTFSNGGTTVTLGIGGTPTAAFSGSIAITIPGSVLTSGNPITVTTNPDAKFNITAAALSGEANLLSVAGKTFVWGSSGSTTTPSGTVYRRSGSVTVGNTQASLGRSDIVASPGATVESFYADADFTTPLSEPVALSVGDNTVYLRIISENTLMTVRYTLTVTRLAGADGPPTLGDFEVSVLRKTEAGVSFSCDRMGARVYSWVLPASASVPTAAEIMARDYMDVDAARGAFYPNNNPVHQWTQLTAGTDYVAYFVASDAPGNISAVYPFPFTTVAVGVPSINIYTVNNTAQSIRTRVSIDEAATLYYLVYPKTQTGVPSAADIKAQGAAAAKGTQTSTTAGDTEMTFTGLVPDTDYVVYAVAHNDAGDSRVISCAVKTGPLGLDSGSLISAAGQPITVTAGDGYYANPYLASITVANSKDTLGFADFVTTNGLVVSTLRVAGAYADSSSSAPLAVGPNTVVVVLWDGNNADEVGHSCYYEITVTRAAPPTPLSKGKVDVPYAGAAADFDDTVFGDLLYIDGDLPDGLSLADDGSGLGILKGTPSKAGTYVFTLEERKGGPGGQFVQEWTFSLTIDPRDVVALPEGIAGNYYAANPTFAVPSNGVDSVQSVGSAPNGLSVVPTLSGGSANHTVSLAITGLPTKSGVYTFGVQLYEGASPAGDAYYYSITINPADYYFLDDVNTYIKGSGLALVHVTEKELVTHSDRVFVTHEGDVSVDAEDQITRDTHYRAEHGSTRITLSPEYLESLAVGPHWLTVGFDDEEEPVQDLFYVAEGLTPREAPLQAGEPAGTTSNPAPKTADDTPLGLMMGLGGAALAGLLGLIWLRRRTRGQER
ncbi:hypothetical protein AGMMS49983_03440 [Clostridia bacterium]|nr:hypothetical protein AGMMS49983_03440 [Clostridia bacterium]